jgi:2-(1,2-epoxy-1,2-dihydrophenyl)acetyl-CoA isomerase
MGSIKVQVALGGLLAKITINRPDKLNAFDRETLREFGDIVRGVTDSAKCRVVVITGEGGAFCAGADLAAAKAAPEGAPAYLGTLAKSFHNILETLAQSPAVVVTLVNGAAAGGGLALALCGDLRWSTPEGRFRLGYGRLGLTVDGGLSWRLPRLIGMSQAQRMFFEDPDLDADEAQALGLTHKVVAPSELVKEFEGLIERTRLQWRGLFQKHRQMLADSWTRTLPQAYETEALQLKTCASLPDGREGIEAFVAKRPPKFSS